MPADGTPVSQFMSDLDEEIGAQLAKPSDEGQVQVSSQDACPDSLGDSQSLGSLVAEGAVVALEAAAVPTATPSPQKREPEEITPEKAHTHHPTITWALYIVSTTLH